MHKKTIWYLLPYLAVLIGLYIVKNAWVTTLIYHAGMFFLMTHTKSWKHLLSGWDKKWAILLVGGGILVGFTFLILAPIITPHDITADISALGLSGISLAVWAAYFSLVNPFLEEPFWRSSLVEQRRGIALNDILFAGYHVLVFLLFLPAYWAAIEFIILIFAGYLFRQCAIRTKGLLIPLLSHLIVDILVGLTIWRIL